MSIFQNYVLKSSLLILASVASVSCSGQDNSGAAETMSLSPKIEGNFRLMLADKTFNRVTIQGRTLLINKLNSRGMTVGASRRFSVDWRTMEEGTISLATSSGVAGAVCGSIALDSVRKAVQIKNCQISGIYTSEVRPSGSFISFFDDERVVVSQFSGVTKLPLVGGVSGGLLSNYKVVWNEDTVATLFRIGKDGKPESSTCGSLTFKKAANGDDVLDGNAAKNCGFKSIYFKELAP